MDIYLELLKKKGYYHIGQLKTDLHSAVWCYADNNTMHFCDSSAKELDRNSLGIKGENVVFTEKDGIIEMMGPDAVFEEFFVINSKNEIILDIQMVHNWYGNKNVLKWITDDTFIIMPNADSNSFDNEVRYYRCNESSDDYDLAYLFVDGVYDSNKYNFKYAVNDYYVLGNVDETTYRYTYLILKINKGIIAKEEEVEHYGIWIHKDNFIHIISFKKSADMDECIKVMRLGLDHNREFVYYQSKSEIDYSNISEDDIYCTDKVMAYKYQEYYKTGVFILYNTGIGVYDDGRLWYTPINSYLITDEEGFDCKINWAINEDGLIVEEKTIKEYKGSDDVREYFDYHHKTYLLDFLGNNLRIIDEIENDDEKIWIYATHNPKVMCGVYNITYKQIIVPPLFTKIQAIDISKGLYKVYYKDDDVSWSGIYKKSVGLMPLE